MKTISTPLSVQARDLLTVKLGPTVADFHCSHDLRRNEDARQTLASRLEPWTSLRSD
jgi:hypothetical protein